MTDESAKKGRDRIQDTGAALIVIGVGMWGVYAVGKYWLGWDITDRDFLPYHLAVIIPGMILHHYRYFLDLGRRLFGGRGRDSGR